MVERLKPSANTAKDVAQRLLRHESAVLAIILAGLIAVMSVVTKGLSTSTTNMANILIQNAPQGLASVGQAFVLLSGGIDVSLGNHVCSSGWRIDDFVAGARHRQPSVLHV
jgi:ribose/xylose/arabinose/galactoside ABC-type transport system permease subunit